jgi:NO-binding membrane sensor protein with MHYT domain
VTDAVGASTLGQAAWLLWTAAVLVVMLGAHVALGYLRLAQRASAAKPKVWLAAAASAALGTGIWAAMLLGVASQDLAYELGFGVLLLAAAWCAAVAAAAVPMALMARWPNAGGVVASGLLIGAGAVVAQMLVVVATGLQPEQTWRWDAIALAGPMAASGGVGGLWIAFLAGGRQGQRRRIWRWLAAAMLGFAVLACQDLVTTAAGLDRQSASTNQHEVPAVVACLVAGIGVPMALVLLWADLKVRRELGRQARLAVPAAPVRRKRMRRRYQKL